LHLHHLRRQNLFSLPESTIASLTTRPASASSTVLRRLSHRPCNPLMFTHCRRRTRRLNRRRLLHELNGIFNPKLVWLILVLIVKIVTICSLYRYLVNWSWK
jgi:hypothetical protein